MCLSCVYHWRVLKTWTKDCKKKHESTAWILGFFSWQSWVSGTSRCMLSSLSLLIRDSSWFVAGSCKNKTAFSFFVLYFFFLLFPTQKKNNTKSSFSLACLKALFMKGIEATDCSPITGVRSQSIQILVDPSMAWCFTWSTSDSLTTWHSQNNSRMSKVCFRWKTILHRENHCSPIQHKHVVEMLRLDSTSAF